MLETHRRLYNRALAERKEGWEAERRSASSQIYWTAGASVGSAAGNTLGPDPDYAAKEAYAARLVQLARASRGRIVTLYQDEFSFCRQPTPSQAWAEKGRGQPLAERSIPANTLTRIVGVLDVVDGRVTYRRATKIGLSELACSVSTRRRKGSTSSCITGPCTSTRMC
jgi:hypothetical protein